MKYVKGMQVSDEKYGNGEVKSVVRGVVNVLFDSLVEVFYPRATADYVLVESL